MTPIVIIAVGLAAGLLSGLIGIGGGVLMVPFLYFFYDRPDLFGVVVAPEARVVLAHGTSLFVITPTALRGAAAFNRANLVRWRAVWPVGAASVLAALAGGALATVLPPEALKTAFGALLIVSGARLLYRRRVSGAELSAATEPMLSLRRTIAAGLLIGVLSALLGVGGGTVGIPLLIYVLKLDLKEVAATSIGIMGFTAAAGAISYMILGFGDPGLPRWSVGYVDMAAGLGMLMGAVVSVRWGAALNQKLEPRALELLFGTVFMLLGLRLVGANLLSLAVGVIRG